MKMAEQIEIERLRDCLKDIAETAEQYNYIGWQRICGVMRRKALEALKKYETNAAKTAQLP